MKTLPLSRMRPFRLIAIRIRQRSAGTLVPTSGV
jgi:hypothetical protein